MSDTYTVIYTIENSCRPKTWQSLNEDEAIRFSSHKPGSVIRRDSDNAILDMVSGAWIKIANSQIT